MKKKIISNQEENIKSSVKIFRNLSLRTHPEHLLSYVKKIEFLGFVINSANRKQWQSIKKGDCVH